MKKYSFIIPHYNSVKSLLKLLDTIPKNDDIQIIIVDDNSTDDISAAENYVTANPQCELYQNDTGVQSAGACRNIGLKHAHGKWVLFADADDYFLDNLQAQLDLYYDTIFDVIYFTPTSIDLLTNEISDRHLNTKNRIDDYLREPSFKNNVNLRLRNYVVWSKMISRELLVGFGINFEETYVANDTMFSAKLGSYAIKIKATSEVIYCVTKGANTLTSVTRERYKIRRAAYIRRYLYLKMTLFPNEWKLLKLAGASQLQHIINEKLGLAIFLETLYLFIKNRVRIFPSEYFNPVFLIRKLRSKY
ncbi:MAG: glycosyltransferase [Lachnospiraceae bacterium]|nr:glycosyltransferase [Lachnospiraceae bacterium]